MKRETVRRPRIKCKPEVTAMLYDTFGVSKTVIYQALAFFCNNAKAMKIRQTALENKGKLVFEEFSII